MICDARRPVAIGGVMGGAQTEISTATRDVLVEAAEFDPVSIRNTARQLNLHSDSSYRFERRIDPEGLDWASRRCCELILEIAGGELAAGVIDVGQPPPAREPIVLRLSQIERILGISVLDRRVREILTALGNEVSHPESFLPSPSVPIAQPTSMTVVPPSWRRDLTREIDLIEEVGRIHGYDAIPEDVSVPMVPSARRRDDRVFERIRRVLTAAGFDEALTLSVVDAQASASMSPWTDAEPLRSLLPVIRGADHLRRSLVPSLLAARRTNESLANAEIELFEIAKVYLPQGDDLPHEDVMLAISSGRDYLAVKGVIETILAELKITVPTVGRRRRAGDSRSGRLLPPAIGRRNVRLRRPADSRGDASVRSSRAGRGGRNPLGAAGRGGRSGAAMRSAVALSGGHARLEPGGGRIGSLGRHCRDGARARRPLFRVARIPRHVPRREAARRQEKPPLLDRPAARPTAR